MFFAFCFFQIYFLKQLTWKSKLNPEPLDGPKVFFKTVTFILSVKTNSAEQTKQGPLLAANNKAQKKTSKHAD